MISDAQTDADRARLKRQDELRRIPLADFDQTNWPRNIRQIAMSETGGLQEVRRIR